MRHKRPFAKPGASKNLEPKDSKITSINSWLNLTSLNWKQITTERRAHESTKLELSSNKAYKCDRDDAIKKNNDLIESYNLLVTEYLELRIKLNLIKVEISNLQTEKDARLRQLNDYESELDEAWAKMSYAFLRVKNVKEAAP
ncbi:hypothetical protein N7476_003165 [Penicillium atrosanguineum]|uniref:Uncharacterized protein n=1 Tax=Penicillium atrosanguineum TaxID=1132637 RepID=A0A9W9Q4Q4_9EURO|nr:hypothetical protein N7526_004985 [Penicillium atrosanguineum]KAJ5324565.1 hypothetical protein N7476_003165 [Penicillium atrosanguineum]